MKRIIFFISVFAVTISYAQQATYLYFEDKDNLRDSLKIVISPSDDEKAQIVRYTPDEAMQVMADGSHWVLIRERSQWDDSTYSCVYVYEPFDGIIELNKVNVFISADRMPVTISWDKSFFINNDLKGSVLSDMLQWFDVAGNDYELYGLLLSEDDSCVLHNIYSEAENSTFEHWGDMLVKCVGLSVGTFSNLKAGIEMTGIEGHMSHKFLRNGQLIIRRGDKTYTIHGTEIK